MTTDAVLAMTRIHGKQILRGRLQLGLTRAQFTVALAALTGSTISDYQLQNLERAQSRVATEDEHYELVTFFNQQGLDVLALSHADGPDVPPLPVPIGMPRRRPAALARGENQGRHLPPGPIRQDSTRLVSNSEVQTFLDCRRKWWLQWYRGITTPRESPTGAAAIGQRIHRALEALYVPEGQEAQDPRDVLEMLIVQDWTALTEAGLYSDELQTKFNAEANLERAMIAGYVDWLAETGEDANLLVIGAEKYLEAPLLSGDDIAPGTGITSVRIIGKIDIRVRMLSDGSRRIVDTKTTASFDELEYRLRLGDPQMLHYLLLEWLATPDAEERCNGALFNAMRKVKRTGNAKPPFYRRMPANYSDRQLLAYRTRLEGQITDILAVESDLARGVDPISIAYPHPSRDCSWKCPFTAVCPMFDDGSAAEDFMSAMYVVRNPMSYYQTQGDAQ